jgi:hypothetical protein
MKRSILFAAALFALASAPAYADDIRWDALRVYRLADGRGVALAYPGEWREVSKTRELQAGAPARFIDPAGRRIEIPAEILARAADTKSVARPPEYRRVALRSR